VIVKEFTVTLTVSGDAASSVDETWLQAAVDEFADQQNKHGAGVRIEDVVVTLVNEEPI
jgi:hypothetical protein